MPEPHSPPVPSVVSAADLHEVGIHHDLIKAATQETLAHTSPAFINRLNEHPFTLPEWFINATPEQRTALKESQRLNQASFTAVNAYLNKISTVEAFAAPLLERALKDRFDITCDVKRNVITLTTLNWFTNEVESSTTQTLLQAALHNFEPDQAQAGGIARGSYLWSAASHHSSDPAPQKIEIEPMAFVRLCRELDIGGQYQSHLKALLDPPDAGEKRGLEQVFTQHERHVLMLQADIALMKGDILHSTHSTLIGYCRGEDHPLFNDLPMTCNTLALDDIPFKSMILSHGTPLEQGRRCIVYIPGDPISCIKEYPTVRAASADLIHKLHDKSYRDFFIHLAPQYQKLKLIKRFNNRFIHASRDPLGMQFSPIPPTLFHFLYAQKKQQLFEDAYFLAVPTATVNRLSVVHRLEHYLDISLNVLNVAALFVPGVGEVMTVVFAAQIMTDIYHGIEAWEQGEQALAWGYTKSVLTNLAFAAAAGKFASELARPVPVERSPYVEELQVVTVKDAPPQLWRPDLRPYEHDIHFDAWAKTDPQGLYTHADKKYLRLEGKHYQLQAAPDKTYRLQHPGRPDAYAPLISTNGRGAWLHEAEELNDWNQATLIRRLDGALHGISDEQALNLLHVSGVDAAQLQLIYIEQTRPPALLDDCIQRFKAQQMLDHFITRMRVGDVKADPLLQLQILVEAELWPRTKALRCLDSSGQTIIEYGNGSAIKRPVLQILDSQVRQGELLSIVLQSLDSQEIRDLIGPDPITGTWVHQLEAQVKQLCSTIADHAERLREPLFASQYRLTQLSDDALVKRLTEAYPGLPAQAGDEMIKAAASAEIWRLENGAQVPLRLKEEALAFVQETRLMRTYEGLYFDYEANPDTQKMILHSLAQMPGWPTDLRLEVHDRMLYGPLLDYLGPEDAPVRKVLVKQGKRYSTFNGHDQMLHGLDDIYASVLHALQDEHRAALGFPHTGQGQALKEALAERPAMDRHMLRMILGISRASLAPDSPLQLTRGRRGYPRFEKEPARCGRAPFVCFPANPRRIRHLKSKLYPAHTYQSVEGFLGLESLYSREGLTRLEALNKEYKTLRNSLNDWVGAPLETVQVSEFHQRPVHIRDKTRAANKIIRCWQRSSGMSSPHPGARLNLNDINLATLPTLKADFSHVTTLEISNTYLHRSVEAFLTHFPNLEEVKFEASHLRELPDSLFSLQHLKLLNVRENYLALSPRTATQLAVLKKLRAIDLSHNPLGVIPDFSALTELVSLKLRSTGLTAWPTGIEYLEHLTHLDMRGNFLTTLPPGYFQLPATRLRNTFVHDNPFTGSTLEAVNTYRRHLGLAPELRSHAVASAPEGQLLLWLEPDLIEAERTLKTNLWDAVASEPQAQNFFKVIQDLVASADFEFDRQPLTRKVWQVLETAADDSAYRAEVFANSIENETCVDRTSTIFSRFGFKLLLREALLSDAGVRETKLLALMTGRVRLLELDDIAQTQIALQAHAYTNAVNEAVLAPDAIQRLKPDELEVKLIYQVDLAQRLQLPWQPSHMRFRNVAKITPQQIEEAYQTVINKEATPGYMAKKLLEEDVWRDYIESTYSSEINAANTLLEQRYSDIESLQEKQQQWALTMNSTDAPARALLESELKALARRLALDQTRVFTGAPMTEADYLAELAQLDQQRKKPLERITQKILDRKTLATIEEE